MGKHQERLVLGNGLITIEEFVDVARFHKKVDFSESYCNRVQQSNNCVKKCVEEERIVYGTTTGFGALVNQSISKEETEELQRNIVLTHATSVGDPFGEEEVRAIILMVLNSLGRGVSGVRLELLEVYRQMLNLNLIPYTPKEGSVGYLCAEGHIAAALIGEGECYYQGQLYPAKEAFEKAGLTPFVLSYKEGLALLNGTTSSTAMAALAIYDLQKAVKTADIIGAVSLEALQGLTRAYSDEVTDCRPQKELKATAKNILSILDQSEVIEKAKGSHIQDALSLRCIPQLHGAVKRTLNDAYDVIETEINACGDNPILCETEGEIEVFSNGNPDASYVGIEMDSACIAATALAKMSERRNARFLDANLSGYPWFLVKKPGLNSGLMIPQYTQAGLLNDMRMLSSPATVDSVSTSANQEDYVSMGYNAGKKALQIVEKLEYVLAIELLSAYQAQQFLDSDLKRGKGSAVILEAIKTMVPVMEEDLYLFPYIRKLKSWIHSGEPVKMVENSIGAL
ncbi:MAG: HAL/PAL/TAL family ammonia-lyase [Eubacteriaceae bacterium]